MREEVSKVPSFQIEVVPASALSEEKREQLALWFREEFGYIPLKWAAPEWYVLARSGSALTGRLGIISRTVLVQGQSIRIGGVSGVIVKKELRRSGLGRALMAEAVKVMDEKLNVAFGLLLCRSEVSEFYSSLGWRVNEFSTSFEQPEGIMIFPRLTMTYGCKGYVWPQGTVDLNGLPW